MCCRLQVVKATEVTAGLAESNGSLLPGLWRDSLHVTCGLTAYIPGSAPGPTLGNEYGKTLPFFLYYAPAATAAQISRVTARRYVSSRRRRAKSRAANACSCLKQVVPPEAASNDQPVDAITAERPPKDISSCRQRSLNWFAADVMPT